MSRTSKIFVGLLSFLPAIMLIIFLFKFYTIIPSVFEWNQYEPAPQEVFGIMAPIFLLGIIMAVISMGLLVFFIIHLVGNKKTDSTERVIWILAFLFAGLVGYPLYWYLRIWKNEQTNL